MAAMETLNSEFCLVTQLKCGALRGFITKTEEKRIDTDKNLQHHFKGQWFAVSFMSVSYACHQLCLISKSRIPVSLLICFFVGLFDFTALGFCLRAERVIAWLSSLGKKLFSFHIFNWLIPFQPYENLHRGVANSWPGLGFHGGNRLSFGFPSGISGWYPYEAWV